MPLAKLAPDTSLDPSPSPGRFTKLPPDTQLDEHPSALASYLQGSWEGVKEAGRDIVRGAKDIGQSLLPGQDPRPGFERLKEIGMFASGGLTSPIGPQRSGPLSRADRARMGNPPPAKSVTVEDFLQKAAETKPGEKDASSSMSVAEMAHLLDAVLRHDPMAIARILGKKYLSDRDSMTAAERVSSFNRARDPWTQFVTAMC
jgi:hypothetical protein